MGLTFLDEKVWPMIELNLTKVSPEFNSRYSSDIKEIFSNVKKIRRAHQVLSTKFRLAAVRGLGAIMAESKVSQTFRSYLDFNKLRSQLTELMSKYEDASLGSCVTLG